MTFDGKAFGAEIVGAFKKHVAHVLAPVLRRLDEIEKREPLKGDAGVDGAPGKDGRDGKDAPAPTAADILAAIAPDSEGGLSPLKVAVVEYFREFPVEPKIGPKGESGRDGQDGAPGKDGADAPPVTDEQIAAAVAKYLTENPPAAGKDGRDGADGRDGQNGAAGLDGKDGAPGAKGVDGRDGENGKDGADGRDGIGMAGAVISRDGRMVVTMTDGTPRDLGCVIGKDGSPGRDGAAGKDGVGFDDLDLVESEDGVFLRFVRGDQVKSFRLPVVTDCGVYREGKVYHRGNGVTWAGSFWIAQEETTEKPDSGKGWRLSVKRGRDGKDAR